MDFYCAGGNHRAFLQCDKQCGECKAEEDATNVVTASFNTMLPIPPDRICDAAKAEHLKLCIIVGVDKSGDLYFASTEGDCAMVLWQLERAKKALLADV